MSMWKEILQEEGRTEELEKVELSEYLHDFRNQETLGDCETPGPFPFQTPHFHKGVIGRMITYVAKNPEAGTEIIMQEFRRRNKGMNMPECYDNAIAGYLRNKAKPEGGK